MPLRKLLVPLDGSPTSEAALPFAEALGLRLGATLALIRAVHTQSMAAIAEAETYLAGFAEQLSSRGLQIETGVPFGAPAEWILEEIALRKADMVVMATHDRSGPDRWLHGSVVEAVISRTTTPILVIRAAAPGVRPVERLDQPRPVFVVPLDGSELSEAALPLASRLATDLGGVLNLVSVVPRPGQMVYAEGIAVPHTEQDSARMEREAEIYLRTVTAQLGADLVAGWRVRLGDPITEIVTEAERHSAAAIVMATHGRAGIMRTLLGSVAGQVVHTATSPVLLVRPGTLRGAEQPAQEMAAAAT